MLFIHDAESDSNSPMSMCVYSFLYSRSSTIRCTSAVLPEPVKPHKFMTVGLSCASGKRYQGIISEITSSITLSNPRKRSFNEIVISRRFCLLLINSLCKLVEFIILFFSHPHNARMKFSFYVHQVSLAFHDHVNILVSIGSFLRTAADQCDLLVLQ